MGEFAEPIRRKTSVPPVSVGASPATGHPIEPWVRDPLEESLGHDFSHVRVHVGPEASRASAELGAKALTVGSNIVFGAGRYSPATGAGRALLAHELVHVIQQKHAGADSVGKLETEATNAGRDTKDAVVVTGAAPAGVQRAPLSDAEIAAANDQELNRRLEANAEESSTFVLSPEALDALDREREAIQRRLSPPVEAAAPASAPEGPRIPKKGVKTAVAPDAFQGIDYELVVGKRLPKEDTWVHYASNAHFNVGRAMRVGTDGAMTTLYYAAAVKWPGFKGPQWIIGPDSIDDFMARAEDFHLYTTAAPQDSDALRDWEREVHLAKMAMYRGQFGKALGHIGASHVEKWSDEPVETILDLLPGGGGRRPRPRAKVGPPKGKLPTQPPTVGPPDVKPPVKPPVVSAQPEPKPAVLESKGAAPPGTKTMEDPFTGQEGQVVATSKTPRSQRTATAASRAEFEAYDTALHKNKEYGIQRPGGVNQAGPDFITARRDAQGRIEVIVNDSTINPGKKPKTSPPREWQKEVDAAVAPKRLDLGNKALEDEIREAVKAKRVRVRTQLVTTTPQGVSTITDM